MASNCVAGQADNRLLFSPMSKTTKDMKTRLNVSIFVCVCARVCMCQRLSNVKHGVSVKEIYRTKKDGTLHIIC